MKNSDNLESCIRNCWECRNECQTAMYQQCLEMGGKHVESAHLKLMTDCIQICQTAADFMTRGSDLHMETCAACAAVCEACAKSCDQVGGEDMKKCAETCRQCAASCREMSQMKKAA